MRHQAEVKNVILEEFDLKKQISLEKKESFEEGREEGREEGQEFILALNQKLIEASRFDELKRATIDPEYRMALLKEFNITE